jgi:hypothetical protein
MSVVQFIFLFSILGEAPPPIDASGLPQNLRQAETQGLHRLDAAELRQLAPILRQHRGMTGTGADTVAGGSPVRRIDNTYCYVPAGQTTSDGESCLAIFRAADGIRYVGYDIEAGSPPRVWRAPPQ